LVSARGLRPLHVRDAHMSLHRNRLPALRADARVLRELPEQKELHECLLRVHPVLVSARGLRPLHVRDAHM